MGYRKFTVTLVGMAAAVALAYLDKLTPQASALIGGLAAGYMALNMVRRNAS